MNSLSPINQPDAAPRPRKRRNRFSFFVLFAGILVFIAAGTALYFALRPETLRIAVGPPNSDDQRLIKALGQTFGQPRMSVGLAPIQTSGPAESLMLRGANKTDPAVARADLDMPGDA